MNFLKTLPVLGAVIALSTLPVKAETKDLQIDKFTLTITDCTPECVTQIEQSEPLKQLVMKCSTPDDCQEAKLKVNLPNCVESSCHLKIEATAK